MRHARLGMLLLLLLCGGACKSLSSAPKPAAPASESLPETAQAKGKSSPGKSAISLANYESADANETTAPPKSEDPSQGLLPPGGQVMPLELPPLENEDIRLPVNLAAALRLADARPLIVTAAQASAWQAEAQMQQADVLWLPDFYFGFDYTRHDGYGPDTLNGTNVPPGYNAQGQPDPTSFGKSLQQDINFVYAGGAFYSMTYLTDAIYEPLRARQHLNQKRWEIQTAKNEAVLMTARAYFDVHKYRGQYAGALDVVKKGRQLMAVIETQSKDLVPAVEVDRAQTLVADMEQEAATARQNWRRASIDLTQTLRLDPRVVVEPAERDHLQITLIDPSRSLEELMPLGLTNRPELAAYQAQIQEMLVTIRREKNRSFLPSLVLTGFQTPYEMWEFGVEGIGSGSSLNNWHGRVDLAPQLLWQADALGFGNLAMVKRQRSQASRAIIDLFNAQDTVVADVTRAQASLQSTAARVLQAERELRAAQINYLGNVEGLKQTKRFGDVLEEIFRPQEAVFALQLLKTAYDRYFETVAEYNQAQFEMYYALGYPAQDLSRNAVAGDAESVDTERPEYLPSVGTGPPPATR